MRLLGALAIFVLSCLVVISPIPAQAFVPPPVVPTITPVTAFKFGITKPGPVGWAIAAGAVGWLAYSNRDSIVGFFGGDKTALDEYYGGLDGDGTGPRETWGPRGWDSNLGTELVSVNGNEATFRVWCINKSSTRCDPWGAGTPAFYWHSAQMNPNRAQCKKDDGSTVWGGFNSYVELIRWPGGDNWDMTRTFALCPSGTTLKGFELGPSNFHSYGLAWGTLAGPNIVGSDLGIKQFDVTVTCRNAETGATENIAHTSPFGKTLVIPSCKQRLGDDWYATKVKVQPVIDPETLPEDVPLWDVPNFPPWEWDEEIPDEVQPCDTSKRGCSLGVWIDNDPCEIDVPICKQWKTKVFAKSPQRVECYYGQRQVDVKWCFPLEFAYDSGRVTEIDPGIKPTPRPDPTEPIIEKPINPGPPITTPINPVVPVLPVDPPGTSGACWQAAISWNPVDWIYTPVKCAMTWAFVPETSLTVRLQRIGNKIKTKVPFSWVTSAAALPAELAVGSSCPNWRIRVASVDRQILCGTAFGNAMRDARPVWVVLMSGAAVYPLLRSIMYASFPVVKPSPTK